MSKPIYSNEKISPAKAKEWLQFNIGNRLVTKATVDFYAKQMAEGKWRLTGENIKFAKSGRLIDGQHRLLAVIKSGVTIENGIVRNLDEDIIYYIDQGRMRTPKDVFRFSDVPDCVKAAAVAKRTMTTAAGEMGATSGKVRGISNYDVLEFYLRHEEELSPVVRLADKCYRRLNFLTTAEIGGIAGFLIVYKGHPYSRVEDFFKELFFADKGIPVVALLRDRLVKDRMSRNVSLGSKAKLALIAKTWNAWLKGEQKKQLRANLDEEITFD